MKILHYSLGFPPYRTGGLTKFCIDLMKQQVYEGHNVSLIWPGEILNGKITKIRNNRSVDGIQNWEIINPVPVSYDEGIKNIEKFKEAGDYMCYERFLRKVKPDVIHVHTLMGLHKNFIMAANAQDIHIVFSAHDFFPICPKVTMFRNGQVCESISNCARCTECNTTALPLWKIKFLQSKIYRKIKDFSYIKKLRKRHRDEYLSGISNCRKLHSDGNVSKDYLSLRKQYANLLNCMDIIHYNSSITKKEYETYIGVHVSEVIPITHSDIKDNRKIKLFSYNKLRISYLGPYGEAKGFFLLKEALDDMWKERQDFCLNIFFDIAEKEPYINIHSRYTYFDLDKIFNNTDVLVVPSLWYETFGYTTLEAISYGVPVIITGNVGAKDIVPEGAGIIINDISVSKLKDVLNNLTRKKLKEMNRSIIKNAEIMTISDMSSQIMQKCYMRF